LGNTNPPSGAEYVVPAVSTITLFSAALLRQEVNSEVFVAVQVLPVGYEYVVSTVACGKVGSVAAAFAVDAAIIKTMRNKIRIITL